MVHSSLAQNTCRLLIMTVQCFGFFFPSHEAIYRLLYAAVTKGDVAVTKIVTAVLISSSLRNRVSANKTCVDQYL